MAGSLPSVDSGFLNFSKRPLQAWETSIWTWMSSICQIWPNSSDGCPLWAAVARPPEVLLTWILFYLLDNGKLLIMDVESFKKVHLGPEIWLFENELPKSVTFASILRQTVIARPPGAQMTHILFLLLEYWQALILGTGSGQKDPFNHQFVSKLTQKWRISVIIFKQPYLRPQVDFFKNFNIHDQ